MLYRLCCWHPLSSRWFAVASLSAIADLPGVTNGVVGVSAVPFKHVVAGGPAFTGFPAVDGVLLLLASLLILVCLFYLVALHSGL
jgi:hypothetical protein